MTSDELKAAWEEKLEVLVEILDIMQTMALGTRSDLIVNRIEKLKEKLCD